MVGLLLLLLKFLHRHQSLFHGGTAFPQDDIKDLLNVIVQFGDVIDIFLQFELVDNPFFSILV